MFRKLLIVSVASLGLFSTLAFVPQASANGYRHGRACRVYHHGHYHGCFHSGPVYIYGCR